MNDFGVHMCDMCVFLPCSSSVLSSSIWILFSLMMILSLSLSSCITEVKFQPQHTEGAEHSNVEPITPVSRALGLCDK